MTTVPFIPASKLNELRREVIDSLTVIRLEHFKYQQKAYGEKAFNQRHTDEALTVMYPEQQLNFQGNVVNKLAEGFYHHHGVEIIEPGLEVQSDYKNKQIMTTHHCLKYTFGMCSKVQKTYSGP